jgi:hypothetical protein
VKINEIKLTIILFTYRIFDFTAKISQPVVILYNTNFSLIFMQDSGINTVEMSPAARQIRLEQ